MKKSVSTLAAALCVAFLSTGALAEGMAGGSTRGALKGGSDYDKTMQQSGMSGMSGMAGMTGMNAAPEADKAKPAAAKKKAKKKAPAKKAAE